MRQAISRKKSNEQHGSSDFIFWNHGSSDWFLEAWAFIGFGQYGSSDGFLEAWEQSWVFGSMGTVMGFWFYN